MTSTINTNEAAQLNLRHYRGSPLELQVADNEHASGDTYELVIQDCDWQPILRETLPNTAGLITIQQALGSAPTGLFQYSIVRTRSTVKVVRFRGTLTHLPQAI